MFDIMFVVSKQSFEKSKFSFAGLKFQIKPKSNWKYFICCKNVNCHVIVNAIVKCENMKYNLKF